MTGGRPSFTCLSLLSLGSSVDGHITFQKLAMRG